MDTRKFKPGTHQWEELKRLTSVYDDAVGKDRLYQEAIRANPAMYGGGTAARRNQYTLNNSLREVGRISNMTPEEYLDDEYPPPNKPWELAPALYKPLTTEQELGAMFPNMPAELGAIPMAIPEAGVELGLLKAWDGLKNALGKPNPARRWLPHKYGPGHIGGAMLGAELFGQGLQAFRKWRRPPSPYIEPPRISEEEMAPYLSDEEYDF